MTCVQSSVALTARDKTYKVYEGLSQSSHLFAQCNCLYVTGTVGRQAPHMYQEFQLYGHTWYLSFCGFIVAFWLKAVVKDAKMALTQQSKALPSPQCEWNTILQSALLYRGQSSQDTASHFRKSWGQAGNMLPCSRPGTACSANISCESSMGQRKRHQLRKRPTISSTVVRLI